MMARTGDVVARNEGEGNVKWGNRGGRIGSSSTCISCLRPGSLCAAHEITRSLPKGRAFTTM